VIGWLRSERVRARLIDTPINMPVRDEKQRDEVISEKRDAALDHNNGSRPHRRTQPCPSARTDLTTHLSDRQEMKPNEGGADDDSRIYKPAAPVNAVQVSPPITIRVIKLREIVTIRHSTERKSGIVLISGRRSHAAVVVPILFVCYRCSRLRNLLLFLQFFAIRHVANDPEGEPGILAGKRIEWTFADDVSPARCRLTLRPTFLKSNRGAPADTQRGACPNDIPTE
jgi:hypothetical protein